MASQLDCPHCGNADINALRGHRVDGDFDGVLFWECLRCGKAYPRMFVSGDEAKRLALAARSYVIEWNRNRG